MAAVSEQTRSASLFFVPSVISVLRKRAEERVMAQYPPLRRDNVTHTYRNAAAFNQHSAQMRQAGIKAGLAG